MPPDLIAIDARYVRERPSGIGAMVEAVVRLVPALMPDARFLLLRHRRAPVPLSREPNVRELELRAEANGPGTLWWLPRLVDLRGVSLFHAPFNVMPAWLRMPTVVTIHDLLWLTHPELCGARGWWGRVQAAFYRDGIRRALGRAALILAPSQATRRAIARVEPAAAERTEVIAHGIDPVFSPARGSEDSAAADAARARLLPGAKRHVLVVGQAAPHKNQRRAVEAFLAAFRHEPDMHLALVQRLGSDARRFLELARRAGAEQRVQVLPTVERADLVALYRGATCLCQPSLCEGWGMPVSEALGTGCPVVASDAEAIGEVAQGAALQVDARSVPALAEALRQVAHDPALRASMARAGLERARSLSWQEHARKTAEAYRRLLSPTSADRTARRTAPSSSR